MYEIEFAVFAAIVFVFALVSRRVERLNVTAPMAFIVSGMLFGASHVASSVLNADVLLLVGSITLVLVLFTDASRINISLFRVNVNLPARLLVIGLPLTIAAGAVIAALLFTNLTIWQAAIIGAVLAPTDAGLGQAIVASERVPVRIREALNVESGLNDGGAVPFLLVFLALAAIQEGVEPPSFWVVAAEQIATIVLATVILSVFAHGISARPGAALYARKVATMDSNAPELRDVSQLPARKGRIISR
jgi:sodium/hydrogen antiporter